MQSFIRYEFGQLICYLSQKGRLGILKLVDLFRFDKFTSDIRCDEETAQKVIEHVKINC